MGGLEFDTYIKIFKKINGNEDFPLFNERLYQKILEEKKLFILPGVVKGTGQFPDSTPRVIENSKIFDVSKIERGENIPDFFTNFDIAYAVLNISLAVQTRVALERTETEDGYSIFVEGGFRKNQPYNTLLTNLYSDSDVFLTNLNEATAFGAAILGKCATENLGPYDIKDLFEIEFKKVMPVKLEGFDEYIKKFLKLL